MKMLECGTSGSLPTARAGKTRPGKSPAAAISTATWICALVLVSSAGWAQPPREQHQKGARPSSAAQQPREILNWAEIVPHVGAALPLDTEFLDHHGDPVRLAAMIGDRPTVLCLVYYQCPMLCKLAADGLVRGITGLQESVGQDFNIALISFDPRDTPAQAAAARTQALRQYARGGQGEGWYFLTGPQPAIDAITQAVGFHYAWDETTQQFSHASGLMIISPGGVITQYLDGVRFTPDELRTAVQNSAAGTPLAAEPISFARCYLYDPTTGKFGAAVQWTVRVLGLLTVLGIGGLVYRLSQQQTVPQSGRS